MDKKSPKPPLSRGSRVRIAPSPTGNLHVGTARAALFNELFARKHGGKFIVRIEDTDKERSKLEFEKNILDGLNWLGITWDEGPYRQSERVDLHRAAIAKLLQTGKAYEHEVEDGRRVIKLKVKRQEIVFEDLIRGKVTTHADAWGGDFVIARSHDDPVFHLAVVVDDAEMKISHVIRGDDHLSNTARHILIQRALGYETPQYAHLPLLLDEQRRKLSKRSGETNLLAYKDMGFLPEAMVNYLALLGWNPGGDREFITHEELRQEFSLEDVQKSGAIFSLQKLAAFNKHYLRELSGEELLERTRPFLPDSEPDSESGYLTAALQTEQDRAETLKELGEGIGFFLADWQAKYDPELLIWRKSDKATTRELLGKLKDKLSTMPEGNFGEERLSDELMGWIDEHGLGRGDVLWPMRVAFTGQEHSPGPFEVGAVLGKDEIIQRIKTAILKLA